MQLIRAINKSNRSNNNNQTSSASFNKVVIVAPPIARSSSATQQKNGNSGQSVAPASPSVVLPALKKRTSIVKQSVPPPVPARRGSPRSKSNFLDVSRSVRKDLMPKPTLDVDRLLDITNLDKNGCQKVKEWLKTVEIPLFVEDKADIWIPEQVEFRSVRCLIDSFAQRDGFEQKTNETRRRVADSSVVKSRVNAFNSLQCLKPSTQLRYSTNCSSGGTDSGIDIPPRLRDKNRNLLHQFSREGEFV